MLTARLWRGRRAAAIAGIIFGVLLITALVLVRVAVGGATTLQSLEMDAQRRSLIRLSLNLVPFAGIAFLWFIGVIREQISAVEDRLFSTVFLGSGLLFLAMLFVGTVTATSLLGILPANANADVWAYGQYSTQGFVSVYAMRMAAVFTLSVSTLGLRTGAMPRWVALVGYAIALVLLVGSGQFKWSQLVFPAWVLLVSIVILYTRPPGRPSVTE